MGDRSKIEWTDATWNPIRRRWRPDRAAGHACLKISPGCDSCYAGKLQAHYYGGADYPAVSRESLAAMTAAVDHGDLYLDPVALTQPLRWKRPRRIFVGSMTDLFGEWVPDAWLDAIWGVMLLAPQHTFQVLTKRPHRMAAYLSDPIRIQFALVDSLAQQTQCSVDVRAVWPLPNLWLGVSVESDRFIWRTSVLAEIPAAVRWISAEPLLGPLDGLSFRWVRCLNATPEGPCGWYGPERLLAGPSYQERCPRCGWGLELLADKAPKIHWVVVGGESNGPAERRLVEPCTCRALGAPGTLIRVTCDRCHGTGWAPRGAAFAWVQNIQQRARDQGAAFFLKAWGGPRPLSGGRMLGTQTYDEYPATPQPALV
jgi:protein gp37